jgi:hypothetical protein
MAKSTLNHVSVSVNQVNIDVDVPCLSDKTNSDSLGYVFLPIMPKSVSLNLTVPINQEHLVTCVISSQ